MTAAEAVKQRAALDACAVDAETAMRRAQFATCAPSWEEATRDAEEAMNAAGRCLNGLLALGAKDPAEAGAGGLLADLSDLAAMNTLESRELLATLERAQELAEAVDAQRGRCVPDSVPLLPGESRGTDLAEAISELCLRLRLEIQGPATARE